MTSETDQPRPVVFAGPSGVGKGTLIELLRKKYPTQFGFSVSHTTRKPREGEQDGVHYNFATVDGIKKEIDEGKFVEYANVHGNYYGTSVAAVESVQKQGKICILDIDVQGVRNVKKSTLDAIYLFVSPPSMQELEKRLRGRGTEKEEAVVKRLANATEEVEYGTGEGNFDRVFTNDDLDKTFEALVAQFQEWYPQLKE
jgi:guanylate kinase